MRFGIQDLRFRDWGSGFAWGLGYGVLGLGFGVQGLGVWSLGFGVWGLGVWDFRVQN